MDKIVGITLLFDTFSIESRNLYESFQNAGIACNAVVIDDDGFLPDGVLSVYGFFLTSDTDNRKMAGKPRYFNEIEIPEYWRIESSNTSGKVMDQNREAARIYYTEPAHHRIVKVVDWLDDRNVVRLCEHYDKHGDIYCRTIFNKNGQKALRKFYSPDGEERIVESFVTGDILVRWENRDWIFHTKTEFACFFMKCAGLDRTAVYFNSLSYPFFTSQGLEPDAKMDALFWHEPIGDTIPGNMQIILNHQSSRTKKIYVQRREAYKKLIALGVSPDIVEQLGYIYSFLRENQHRPDALICTNSDNIPHIDAIAKAVPGMTFHIAAITEMSSKLTAVGQNRNVILYPNVKEKVLDRLFEKCDYYLDINHGGEIADAVHRAFLNDLLIIGYEETMHNKYYTADTNTFPETEYADMAEALNIALQTPQMVDDALKMQREWALSAAVSDYERFCK